MYRTINVHVNAMLCEAQRFLKTALNEGALNFPVRHYTT